MEEGHVQLPLKSNVSILIQYPLKQVEFHVVAIQYQYQDEKQMLLKMMKSIVLFFAAAGNFDFFVVDQSIVAGVVAVDDSVSVVAIPVPVAFVFAIPVPAQCLAVAIATAALPSASFVSLHLLHYYC